MKVSLNRAKNGWILIADDNDPVELFLDGKEQELLETISLKFGLFVERKGRPAPLEASSGGK